MYKLPFLDSGELDDNALKAAYKSIGGTNPSDDENELAK
jgi:hypothetical protein